MIRTIIVEDEPNSRKMLQWLIQHYAEDVEVVAICQSGQEGLELIPQLKPDLVFLDVSMPHMSGLDMLEALPDRDFCLVFTTAHDEYALQAFELSAVHYLLKPIGEEAFLEAMRRVRRQPAQPEEGPYDKHQFLLQQARALREGKLPSIALPTFDGLAIFRAREIIYCQAANNYTDIFLKSKEKICVTQSLKNIEQRLSPFGFMRVHNSILVNTLEVKRFLKKDKARLAMSNGHEVKVSRARRDELMDYLSGMSL